ncbi:LamG domain-containing protein [Nocardiopsis chromatogenes]|uniref:LamG domain-containing protein n=1 Tax=Nocardiopsis chromatogenes TaxID=280239 RepID=UPI001EF9DAED|nr:LamG domain-containing protein [Nocardiopsis chromatogenes]
MVRYRQGKLVAAMVVALGGVFFQGGQAVAGTEGGGAGPELAPEVISSDYPAGHVAGGTIGDTGEFTFSSNGVDDAAAYYYGINTGSCTTRLEPSTVGGDATLTFTPESAGPHTIKARTVDVEGRSSQCETVYTFMVAPLAHPVGLFPFDEGEGGSAGDILDSGAVLEREASLTWTRGRVGERQRLEGAAVRFNGQEAPLATEESLIQTEEDFSFSAWVRLDDKGEDRTAVAQGGPVNGVALGYRTSSGLDNWSMQVPVRDASGEAGSIQVISDEPAREGVWTHLLGTIDQSEDTAKLYVDGVKQTDTGNVAEAAAVEGPLVVGAGGVGAQSVRPWIGAIDDLRVWDRKVFDDGTDDRGDPYKLASVPALEGRWKLDEAEGTVASDASDRRLDGTLEGDPAAVWSGELNDQTFTDAAAFSGVERIITEEPAVRTDRSFSVAAWARPDDAEKAASVVAQTDKAGTGMKLGTAVVDGRMRWVVTMRDGSTVTSAYSERTPLAGEWEHVAGVYDFARGELVLYVDGVEAAMEEIESSGHTDAPFVIGGTSADGGDGAWIGGIDDVHAYRGVLSKSQVHSIEMGFLP